MLIRRRSPSANAFASWLATVPGGNLAPTSIIAYVREAESFTEYAGKPRRKGWKRSQVEGWLGNRTISASTATRALSAVSKYAEFAGRPDPTVGIRRPKRDKGLPKPVEGLPFLLKRMEQDGERELMFVCVFIASTGLRISEVCGENGCAFEVIEDGEALRVHGKGKKDRIVPLSESAKSAWALLAHADGISRIGYTVKQLQAATREYGFHPHQLRHSFGTDTYDRTGDIFVVSKLLGHASVATSQVYAQMSSRRLREAMNGHPAGKGRSE